MVLYQFELKLASKMATKKVKKCFYDQDGHQKVKNAFTTKFRFYPVYNFISCVKEGYANEFS